MSEQAKCRTGRPVKVRGHFINCTHYGSTDQTGKTFHCNKYGTVSTSCEGCPTCPKCGTLLFTYRLVISKGRDRIYADHVKTCVICGAYIEEALQVPLARITERKAADACQVHDCHHTAYEGYQHHEETEGQEVPFLICETHRRRIKTWRLHPDKGEAQKPVMIENGQLVDNPDYIKKQGRHRKGKQA